MGCAELDVGEERVVELLEGRPLGEIQDLDEL